MPGAMPACCPQSGSGPDASADALAAWVTSRARQREQAAVLVAGHGKVVAEFFDSGESRMLPWPRLPQAAALVAALADPGRGWDAIVIGEYERAFYGSQYASMAPLFEHYGIQLWMPEVAAGSTGTPGPRADHAGARLIVQAGDHPDQDPGSHRDGRPDPGAGPVPGRSAAVRIPARRRRTAPE